MRYPRGKSWNWYRRSVKRGDFRGALWLELRNVKSAYVKELATYLTAPMMLKRNFTGLDTVLDEPGGKMDMLRYKIMTNTKETK